MGQGELLRVKTGRTGWSDRVGYEDQGGVGRTLGFQSDIWEGFHIEL